MKSNSARLVTLQGYKRNRLLGCNSPELMGSISSLVSSIPVVGDVISELFGLDDDDDVKEILQAQITAQQQQMQNLQMALIIGIPAVAIVGVLVAKSGKK